MSTQVLQVEDVAVDEIEVHAETSHQKSWHQWQLWGFRISTLFVLQLVLPLQWAWYQKVATVRTVQAAYQVAQLSRLSYYTPSSESGKFGIASFTSWGIAVLASLLGAAIWTWLERKRPRREYRAAYYWVSLIVRYWTALAIMNYGFMKVYPNQMPFPSISNLHTLLGEQAAYRLYWQAVGLVTWYEVVLGLAEVLAGALLLFRRTVAIGALLNLGILYNVAHANIAYDGGVHVHSAAIAVLAAYLLLPYLYYGWVFLLQEREVTPNYYRPTFSKPWLRRSFRYAGWVVILLWIPGYAYVRYDGHYNTNFSKEPRGQGLTGAKGFYSVTEFKLNGANLPYDPNSPVRWQTAVFEDYPTFVYKVNRRFPVLLENGTPAYRDIDKRYELSGFSGGKRYYHYEFNEAAQTLTLTNRYKESDDQFAEKRKVSKPAKKAAPRPSLTWHYTRPSNDRIVLEGVDEDKNHFYAVLDRQNEQLAIHVNDPVAGEPLQYTRTFSRRYPVNNKNFDGRGAPKPQ